MIFDFNPRGAYGGELEQRTERDWRKVRYLYLDVRRQATARGMIIRGPQKLFDSSLAMMGGLCTSYLVIEKDMGRLEYDPATGVYRPVRR